MLQTDKPNHHRINTLLIKSSSRFVICLVYRAVDPYWSTWINRKNSLHTKVWKIKNCCRLSTVFWCAQMHCANPWQPFNMPADTDLYIHQYVNTALPCSIFPHLACSTLPHSETGCCSSNSSADKDSAHPSKSALWQSRIKEAEG